MVLGLNGGKVASGAGASVVVVDLGLRRLMTLRCGGSTGAE